VTYVVRLLGLPMREALMWFGLLELDVSAAARAAERRRADLTLARRSSRPD
jgi:hypothetical protein